jgi:hypothetical protein
MPTTYVLLPGCHVVACKGAIPPGALYRCEEGEPCWTPIARADPALVDIAPPPKLHEPEVEAEPEPAAPKSERDNAARFAVWIQRHPEVYEAFVEIAREKQRAGKRHIGAKAIVEKIRYDRGEDARTDETEVWKVNNIYTSFLVRKAIAEHPDLAGLFELREKAS